MTFPFYLTLRLQQSLPLTLRQLYTIATPQTLIWIVVLLDGWYIGSTVFYVYVYYYELLRMVARFLVRRG